MARCSTQHVDSLSLRAATSGKKIRISFVLDRRSERADLSTQRPARDQPIAIRCQDAQVAHLPRYESPLAARLMRSRLTSSMIVAIVIESTFLTLRSSTDPRDSRYPIIVQLRASERRASRLTVATTSPSVAVVPVHNIASNSSNPSAISCSSAFSSAMISFGGRCSAASCTTSL